MSWEEEAYREYNQLIRAGNSPAEATEITGYDPAKYPHNHPELYGHKKTSFKSHTQKPKEKWYLNVPFADKEEAKMEAKSLGLTLLWDPEGLNKDTNKKGCWYVWAQVYGIYDPAPLRKWQFKSRGYASR